MLQIARALARKLRAVLRKSLPAGSARGQRPPLVLQATRDGLRVRCQHSEVAVEYHLAGSYPAASMILPGEVLDDIEGKTETL